jgi:hypothetical protein
MKQIYGFVSPTELDLDVALRELRERVMALEIEVAELRRRS